MGLKSVYFAVCASILISCSCAEEFVPVYIWETSRTSEIVPALGQINAATFKEILSQKSSRDPYIVVFAEETLSPEDFIETGVVKPFQHLAKLADKVSYLPLVERPVELVKDIPFREVAEVSIKTILDKDTLPPQRVLIVNLNDAKEDEDRTDMLKRHDEAIVSIYKKIAATNDKVLAMYTAYHSSWVIPELTITRQSRSLMAKGDEAEQKKELKKEEKNKAVKADPKYLKLDNLMMYFTNDPVPSYLPSGGEPIELTGLELESAGNESNEVTLKSAAGVEIKLMFDIGNGYWQLTEVVLTHADKTIVLSRLRSYVPKTFSFHCVNARFADLPVNKNEAPNVLTLSGLQMQFFDGAHADTFGDSYDCVGFTTTPIWSGLFVTFIMVLILTAGLIAMMDIKTMDRFDDPKGKTIIINASE